MAAGLLPRCAAGMKNGGALFRWKARKLQFLERGGGHGGNLCPMPDDIWRQTTRLANCPIGGVVFELEREKFERK